MLVVVQNDVCTVCSQGLVGDKNNGRRLLKADHTQYLSQ